MYRFFTISNQPIRSRQTEASWQTVRNGLAKNLDTFTKYYETNPMAVGANHFLTKIINHYGEGLEYDFKYWYGYLVETARDLSMSLKMTSSISAGSIFNGVFYGPGISEVLTFIPEPVGVVSDLVVNWEDIRPVEVLYHPRNDLELTILDGANRTSAKGYAVINVDIVKLMLKYKAFRLWEKNKRIDKSVRYSSLQFIHMHVLPKMIYSHLDYAIFNRFYSKIFGTKINEVKPARPFYLSNWDRLADSVQSNLLDLILGKSLNFSEMLNHIPLVDKETMLEGSVLPQTFNTRQINWALALSRLELIRALLELDSVEHGRVNESVKNRLWQAVDRYRSDQALAMVMRKDHRDNIQSLINSILEYRTR